MWDLYAWFMPTDGVWCFVHENLHASKFGETRGWLCYHIFPSTLLGLNIYIYIYCFFEPLIGFYLNLWAGVNLDLWLKFIGFHLLPQISRFSSLSIELFFMFLLPMFLVSWGSIVFSKPINFSFGSLNLRVL